MVERSMKDGRMTAQLNIKSEEARRLAQDLSQLTGRSMTEVIIDSLRDRLSRVRYARTSEDERARIDHGDLLYDEDGLPR